MTDVEMLERLHRRHWTGKPWRHGCDTDAGYQGCYDDEDMGAADLSKALAADGLAISPDELRRLWELDWMSHCPARPNA